MRADIICSGSKGNCTIIRSATSMICIDCGAPTVKYQKAAFEECGVCKEEIAGVLVTHNHSDHIKQLRQFSMLPIFSFCDLNCFDTKRNPIPLNHRTIRPYEEFSIDDFHILPIGLSHDAGKTIGFVILADGQKLVYITDTGYVRQEDEPLLSNADYYIMESNHDIEMLMATDRSFWLKQRILSDTGHLNNRDSAALLTRAVGSRTRAIVLAHLSEEANTPGLALRTLHLEFDAAGISLENIQVETAMQNHVLTIGADE